MLRQIPPIVEFWLRPSWSRICGLRALLLFSCGAGVCAVFCDKSVLEIRVRVQPGVLCLGGRLVGGSIPTHAVGAFYVGWVEAVQARRGPVFSQWTFPGLTWLVSEVAVACCFGAAWVDGGSRLFPGGLCVFGCLRGAARR